MVAPEMFCWLKSWSKESACGKPPGMPDSSSRPDMHIPGWIWLGDLSPQEMEMAVATPHRRWLTPDPARRRSVRPRTTSPIRRQDADTTSPTPRPLLPPGPRPPRSPLPPPSPLPMAAVVSGRWMPMGNGYCPERPGGSLSEDEFAYPASGTGTGTSTSTGTKLLSSTSTFLQLQVRIYREDCRQVFILDGFPRTVVLYISARSCSPESKSHTQTDRQTDRPTDRPTDRQTDRES